MPMFLFHKWSIEMIQITKTVFRFGERERERRETLFELKFVSICRKLLSHCMVFRPQQLITMTRIFDSRSVDSYFSLHTWCIYKIPHPCSKLFFCVCKGSTLTCIYKLSGTTEQHIIKENLCGDDLQVTWSTFTSFSSFVTYAACLTRYLSEYSLLAKTLEKTDQTFLKIIRSRKDRRKMHVSWADLYSIIRFFMF